MKSVSPVLPSNPGLPEVEIAKDQPQYQTLHGVPVQYSDGGKSIIVCYELDLAERAVVMHRGRIWLELLTFGGPMQPHRLSVVEPLADCELQAAEVAESKAEEGK